MGALQTGPTCERGIIPQHIVVRSVATYVLLLFVVLGACPHVTLSAQRRGAPKPLPAPLLPAEEAWSVVLPAPPAADGALDHDKVYVPLQSGILVALDRETGVQAWTIELESRWAPVALGSSVAVAAAGGLRAVRADSGAPVWATPLDAELLAAPGVGHDRLVVLLAPAELRAYRTGDGQEIWRRTLDIAPPPADSAASPHIAADGEAVVAVWGNRLVRLSIDDGAVQWSAELHGRLAAPLLDGDRIFVGSTDNNLYALQASNGRVAWRWTTGGDVVGAATDGRLVYVASLDHMLRALRRGNGNQAWKAELATRTVAPPVTFDGLVVLAGHRPTLATFDADTGTAAAAFTAPSDVQGTPLIRHPLMPFAVAMVAVTKDGRAIGLRSTAMMFRDPALSPLLALPGHPLARELPAVPRAAAPGPR